MGKKQEFQDFFNRITSVSDLWEKLRAEKRPIWVYGMGNGADKLAIRCEQLGISIAGYFASDEFVRGHSFRGMPVFRYSEVCAREKDFVILLAFGSYREEVLERLAAIAEEHPLYVPDLPLVGNDYFDRAFAILHKEELALTDALWEDDLSRAIFRGVLAAKLNGAFDLVEGNAAPPLRCTENVGDAYAVDVGAYDGDSIRDFLALNWSYKHFIAIEPDPKTFKKLLKFKEKSSADGILIDAIHALSGNSVEEAVFYASGNRNSSVSETHESHALTVAQTTVDELAKMHSVGLIKYDVEGMEAQSLQGSQKTVARCRPVLRVSLYHRSEDIFALPLLCSELLPNSCFYLRRKRCVPSWEMDLYVIPKERSSYYA